MASSLSVQKRIEEIERLAKGIAWNERRELGRRLCKETPEERQARGRNAIAARWRAREQRENQGVAA